MHGGACQHLIGQAQRPAFLNCMPMFTFTSAPVRHLSSTAHLGVLQVFKLELVPNMPETALRMLLPSGGSDATAAAAALDEAAAHGQPVLVSERTLAEMMQSSPDLAQLHPPDAGARVQIPEHGRPSQGPEDPPSDLSRSAEPDQQMLELLEHSQPMTSVVAHAARLSEPDWDRTVARQAEELPLLTSEQLRFLQAAGDGDVRAIERLLARAGPRELLHARLPPSGAAALHLAAAAGATLAVQVLARAGCPVDARAINGSTPLHWAAGGGQTAVVRALLAAGASAEARSSTWCASVRGSDSGQTPAHWAAASGHGETLALLLAAAPHALVLNDERQLTPAGVAAREGYEGLQRALDHLRDQKVVCVRVRRELAIKRRLHA